MDGRNYYQSNGEGKIELSPKFQRKNAWDDSRKSKFIESIILAFLIPQIILAELKDKKGLYIVIDGKQRLLSIRQFGPKSEKDEFKTLTLKDLEILEDLNKKSYEALNNDPTLEEYKAAFEDQTIRTHRYYSSLHR